MSRIPDCATFGELSAIITLCIEPGIRVFSLFMPRPGYEYRSDIKSWIVILENWLIQSTIFLSLDD